MTHPRIDDSLYDLEKFEDKHPGGTDWIRLVRVKMRSRIISGMVRVRISILVGRMGLS